MFNMTAAIVGGAQSGFTTPGYTVTTDLATDVRSKQVVVTAVTGTQAGVTAHSVNSPFTITVRRPSLIKLLSSAVLNGVTGQFSRVPFNEYTVLTRKGCQVALGQWYVNEMRTTGRIAAGSDTFDGPNVLGLASAHLGFLAGNSAGFGQTLKDAII